MEFSSSCKFYLIDLICYQWSLISDPWLYNLRLPKYATKFIEMCLMVTADHGPAVSGAHNTIVCARAGKDLVSCLASGLLTIVRQHRYCLTENCAYVSLRVLCKNNVWQWWKVFWENFFKIIFMIFFFQCDQNVLWIDVGVFSLYVHHINYFINGEQFRIDTRSIDK